MDTFSLMLHVLLAVILVGPQILLAFAVVPSTWLIDDEPLRRNVTRVVTARYGMMAGISIVGLLVTGLYQFYSYVPEPIQEDMTSYRFGPLFISKMTLFVILIAMIFVHARFIAPRIRTASERIERGEGEVWELEQARKRSLLFSLAMIVVSIGVLWLGVALGDHVYSYVQI